jgi:hypothetical protein
MHGLPHHVDRDVTWEEAFRHLMALSNSQRPITLQIGCLTTSGPLRFIKSLGPDPDHPADAEQPTHIFHLGNHGGLVIRPAEFQGAHLWTTNGDDYFGLSLNLAVPLTFTHSQ